MEKLPQSSGLLARAGPDAHWEICDALVAWAVVFHDAQTLQDVFRLDPKRLLKAMGLWERTALIDVLGIAEKAAIPFQVGRVFADAMHQLGGRRRAILMRRTFSNDPEILESLGDSFGVSRERARQLEADAIGKVRAVAGERMARTGRRLKNVFGIAAPLERVMTAVGFLTCDAPEDLQTAARCMLLEYAGYSRSGNLAVTQQYNELVQTAKVRARELADEHGIVDEGILSDALPIEDPDLAEHIWSDSGLTRVLDNLVLRDTRRARLVLALKRIGVPATRDAIAATAGLESSAIGGVLSDTDSIVRITKDTWGFRWWTDDPYEGVVNEILQRIQEDGGETSVDRLLEEIPDKFGIAPATVQASLGTEKFDVQNGRACVADVDGVELRPLSQMRNIFWDQSGRPVFRLEFEERYASGVSIKVPREVVQHLGVGLDESAEVEIAVPEGCQPASVIWRAHDPNGPEIGRLREAFERLPVRPGQEIFLVLDPSGLEVVMDGSDFSPQSPKSREGGRTKKTDSTGPPMQSEAFERIKARRRLWDA